MNHQKPPGAGREPAPDRCATTGARRRRWPAHLIIPPLVALAVGALLVASAGQTLRPTREVAVRPVVFASGVQPVADPAPAGESGRAPGDAGRHARPSGGGRGQVVQAPGWLEADPFFVACTALADGVVEEILVLEGERVDEGQVVARLVSEDAELALARAEAELAFARSKLIEAAANTEAAKTRWDHPIERDRAVETTRAQLAEARAELDQLPALIDAERASLAAMQEELLRQEKALTSGATNELEVIVLRNEVRAQEATVRAIERRRGILESRIDRLAAEVRAAERNAELRIEEKRELEFARAHQEDAAASVAAAEAARDEAKLRLDRMTIRAPISGFVQRRLKVPGDKVMLGADERHSAHLIHLYDPEKIQVRVDIPLADAAHVFVGQRCEVIVDVLPETPFRGEVSRITHEADLQKNTLQAKVRVVDPSPLLRPEMLTRVKFFPEGASPASASRGDGADGGAGSATARLAGVRVPEQALADRSGDTARVWVVRDRRADRGVARPIDVEIVAAEGGWAAVRGALRPGDLLAVDTAGLEAGQPVRMIGHQRTKGGA